MRVLKLFLWKSLNHIVSLKTLPVFHWHSWDWQHPGTLFCLKYFWDCSYNLCIILKSYVIKYLMPHKCLEILMIRKVLLSKKNLFKIFIGKSPWRLLSSKYLLHFGFVKQINVIQQIKKISKHILKYARNIHTMRKCQDCIIYLWFYFLRNPCTTHLEIWIICLESYLCNPWDPSFVLSFCVSVRLMWKNFWLVSKVVIWAEGIGMVTMYWWYLLSG